MTKKLVVAGRRFNDDKQRSTWTILQEQGLVPVEFYSGHLKVSFAPEGDPGEHNWAIYIL